MVQAFRWCTSPIKNLLHLKQIWEPCFLHTPRTKFFTTKNCFHLDLCFECRRVKDGSKHKALDSDFLKIFKHNFLRTTIQFGYIVHFYGFLKIIKA